MPVAIVNISLSVSDGASVLASWDELKKSCARGSPVDMPTSLMGTTGVEVAESHFTLRVSRLCGVID
jgi:hypothetical protein